VSTFIEQPRFSCALGVQQSVIAINRAIPILHAGPGCGMKISAIIGQKGAGGGNVIPCTNSGEAEVIFGGENKLRDIIDGSFKVMDADLFVVLTGCTSDIVGDDVGSVVGNYQAEDKPIVFAETGGFKSSNFKSHELVVNAIIDQYVDKYAEVKAPIKGLVNVFASVPYQDPFWDGNLKEIKRILEGIGLKANVLFGTSSAGLAEWRAVPNAEFNILISTWSGLGIVNHLQEKYGTPFFHFPYLPVGGLETSRFLTQVGEFAKLDTTQVKSFIESEEKIFYEYIERTSEFLLEFIFGLPRRFYTILDASYAIGFSKYLLNELGIKPAKQFIIDDTPEEFQEEIRKYFRNISERRSAEVTFEVDGGLIQQEIRNDESKSRALILGSSWDSTLAKEIGADLLVLGVPDNYRLILNCGYAGYNGGLRVIEDIYDRVLDTFR
jgi:nitrogenase molybdenum-iron protein beta chain